MRCCRSSRSWRSPAPRWSRSRCARSRREDERLMRRFWSNVLAVAYRETIILRHDRAFIGVIVLQPVMMLLLFGLVLSNKPANVPWAILDRSATPASRRLIEDVQATGYFLPPRSIA